MFWFCVDITAECLQTQTNTQTNELLNIRIKQQNLIPLTKFLRPQKVIRAKLAVKCKTAIIVL